MRAVLLFLSLASIDAVLCIYNPSDAKKPPVTAGWRKKALTPREVEMHHGYSRVVVNSPTESQHVQRIWPQSQVNYDGIFNMDMNGDKKDEEEAGTIRQYFIEAEYEPETSESKVQSTVKPTTKAEAYRAPKTIHQKHEIHDKLQPFHDDPPDQQKGVVIPLDQLNEAPTKATPHTISTGSSRLPPLKKEIEIFGFHYPPRSDEVYPFKKSPKQYANMAFEKCPKMFTGQLAFQWSCSQYLNCWKGRGYIQNCSPGTLFSPETLECEYPEKVKCISGPLNQAVRAEEVGEHSKEIHCKSDVSGLLPHPNDCAKFISCDNGKAVVQDCGPGTVFNPKISTCDHPYNTNCEPKINEIDLGLGIGNYLGEGFNYGSGFSAAEKGFKQNCAPGGCPGHTVTPREGSYQSFSQQNNYGNVHRVGFYPEANRTVTSHHLATGQTVQGFYVTAPVINNTATYGWRVPPPCPHGCSTGRTKCETGCSAGEGDKTSSQSQFNRPPSFGWNIPSSTNHQDQGQTGTYHGYNQGQSQTSSAGHSAQTNYSASSTFNHGYSGSRQIPPGSNQEFGFSQGSTQSTGGYQDSGFNQGSTQSTGGHQGSGFNQGSTQSTGGYQGSGFNQGSTQSTGGYQSSGFNQGNTQSTGSYQGSGFNQGQSGSGGYLSSGFTHGHAESDPVQQSVIRQIPTNGGFNQVNTHSTGGSQGFGYNQGQSGSGYFQGQGHDSFHSSGFSSGSHQRPATENSGTYQGHNQGQTGVNQQNTGTHQYDDQQRNNFQFVSSSTAPILDDCIFEDQIASADTHSQYIAGEAKCPPSVTGLLPHPTDCSKYLNCANGRTFVQNCGTGTIFSTKINACDWPANVNCQSHSQGKREGKAQYTAATELIPGKRICSKQLSTTQQTAAYTHGPHHHYHDHHNHHHHHHHPHHQLPGYPHTRYPPHIHGHNHHHHHPHHQLPGYPPHIHDHNHHHHHPHHQLPGYPPHIHGHNHHHHHHHLHGQNWPYHHPHVPPSTIPIWQPIPVNPPPRVINTTSTVTADKPVLPPGGRVSPHVPVYESNFGSTTPKPIINLTPTRFPPRVTPQNQWPPPFPSSTSAEEYDKDNPPIDARFAIPREKSGSACQENEFQCSPKECIPSHWVCDGNRDCANGQDEKSCKIYLEHFTLTPKSRLFKHEIEKWLDLDLSKCAEMCMSSKSFGCKSFNYRREDKVCLLCDTNVGLSGALQPSPQYDYYEWDDFTVNCSDKFVCSNNKCIEHKQVCDGKDDCGNRQDEKNCPRSVLGYDIRLRGSNNINEGRIEIKVFNEWGFICDDQFGLRDADVACKELGFPLGALEVRPKSFYARDVKEQDVFYLMDEVSCLGNETTLRDCNFDGWGVHNCMPEEIVGVVCKTPQESCPKDHWKCDTTKECLPLEFVCDGHYDCEDQSDEGIQHCNAPIEIRLANGTTMNEGRVEIKYHGIWGTICDDDFSDLAARVVCRSIGFYGTAIVKKEGAFGPGSGPIWLDQVKCGGNESFVQDCLHWHWGEHNCEHREDVGVVCSTFDVTELEKKSKDIDLPLSPPVVDDALPVRCGHRNDDLLLQPKSDLFERVVQGSVARRGEYPWQATIRIKGKAKSSHWCGAVVISGKFVLTAAHCLVGFTKGAYFVQAGDYDVDNPEGTETDALIEDFFIHERFRQGGHMNNDIALVKLKGKGLKLSKHVQPICLPEKDAVYDEGKNCTISGFGSTQTGKSTSSRLLRAGWIPLISKSICKLPTVYGDSITDGMICAGSLDEGIDACDGDSGGPLACLDKGLFTLYGITSWGQHCGYANKPGVYVKVSHYRDWIDKKLKENTF